MINPPNQPTVPQLVHELRREFNNRLDALEARMESAYPGADLGRHYDWHVDEAVRAERRRQMWGRMAGNMVQGALGGLLVILAVIFWWLVAGRYMK